MHELPRLTSNKLALHVLGNWRLSGLFRYGSGLPIPVPASLSNMNSLVFQSTRMNRVAGQPLYLVNLNCGCINPYSQLVLNPKAWTDVPNGTWGVSAPFYNDYRYARTPSEQLSLARTFRPREKVTLRCGANSLTCLTGSYIRTPPPAIPWRARLATRWVTPEVSVILTPPPYRASARASLSSA